MLNRALYLIGKKKNEKSPVRKDVRGWEKCMKKRCKNEK